MLLSKYFTLLLLLIYSTINLGSHQFYLTVADIKYNYNSKETKLIFKFFSDDLENSIQDEFDFKLHLGAKNQEKSAKDYISKYIKNHFKCKINNKEISLRVRKLKIPKGPNNLTQFGLPESIWVYCALENTEPINEISLKSDLLMKLFDNNIVANISLGKKLKTIVLNRSNNTGETKFE